MKKWHKPAALILAASLLISCPEGMVGYKAGIPSSGVTVAKAEQKEEKPEWNIQCLNAERSYEESRKLKRIKVAVLDSGLDYDEDIPYVEREDFLGAEELHPLFQDLTGHGTSVASLICASKNDDSITGIAANVDLYAARILDENNEAPVSRVIEAVKWAMEKKVNIIHMSFGTKEYSPALHEIIRQAYNRNILIIASAGNDGTAAEDESTVEYPAAFENVIAVGATNTENRKTEISSSGAELDIVAPGEQILTAGAFGGIAVEEGTSMAAAQVTGIAAVLWGKYPDKSNRFIRELLLRSANISAGSGDCGNGMADYTKSVGNYQKMNAVYHSWKKLGISESRAISRAGESVGINAAPLETHREVTYVKGLWKAERHKGVVKKTKGITTKNINIVKRAAVAPDTVKKTMSLSKHPCFHGGGNYLANTQYLFFLARTYISKGNSTKEPDLPSYQTVFDNKNPYKGVKKKQDIKKNLSDDTREALFKACLKGKEKTWTGKKKGYVMLGAALHNATDAFSHRGYRNLGGKPADWWKLVHPPGLIKNKKVKMTSAGYIWKLLGSSSKKYKKQYGKIVVADNTKEIEPLSRLAGKAAKNILSSVKKKWECYNSFKVAFKQYEKKYKKYKEFRVENVNKYWKKTVPDTEANQNFKININKQTYKVTFPKKKQVTVKIGSKKVNFSMPYDSKQKYVVWNGNGKSRVYFKPNKYKNKITFSASKKKVKSKKITLILTNHSTAKKKTYTISCTLKFKKEKGVTGTMKSKKITYPENKKIVIKNKFKCKGKKFAGWMREFEDEKSKKKKKVKLSSGTKISFVESGTLVLYPLFEKKKKKATKKKVGKK